MGWGVGGDRPREPGDIWFHGTQGLNRDISGAGSSREGSQFNQDPGAKHYSPPRVSPPPVFHTHCHRQTRHTSHSASHPEQDPARGLSSISPSYSPLPTPSPGACAALKMFCPPPSSHDPFFCPPPGRSSPRWGEPGWGWMEAGKGFPIKTQRGGNGMWEERGGGGGMRRDGDTPPSLGVGGSLGRKGTPIQGSGDPKGKAGWRRVGASLRGETQDWAGWNPGSRDGPGGGGSLRAAGGVGGGGRGGVGGGTKRLFSECFLHQ